MALCSLTDFRKAELKMENTTKDNEVKTAWKTGEGCHQDIAPAHTSVVAMISMCDCVFELVDYPNLAPSD